MFTGSIVALITPFQNGEIDKPALKSLVRYHLDKGSHGLVPVGTTGESATLSFKEQGEVLNLVVSEVASQVPVIAGAGSNNTQESIALTKQAAQAGVDGLLHVVGYYNRPSQEGIYQHFAALNEATELPILAYNVPRRTIVDILPETMARLASLSQVVGVKDASCDLARPLLEADLMGEQAENFCFLSGEDPLAVAYNVHGGQGCISVTANIAPTLSAKMQEACQRGDFVTALDIQKSLMGLHQALFVEPSPAGVKYAASLLGLCDESCRLPIVSLTTETKIQIREAMEVLDLL